MTERLDLDKAEAIINFKLTLIKKNHPRYRDLARRTEVNDLYTAIQIMKEEQKKDPATPCTLERLREIMFSLLPMNLMDNRDLPSPRFKCVDPPVKFIDVERDHVTGKLCKW